MVLTKPRSCTVINTLIKITAISASLVLLESFAFSQTTKLYVQSATLELDRHQVSIELYNSGNKTAAAYDIRLLEYDAAGKLVLDTTVGYDNLSYLEPGEDTDAQGLIRPGANTTLTMVTQPDIGSVKGSVTDVVYLDRTVEGDHKMAGAFFEGRATNARELRDALAVVKNYPATPAAFAATLQKLRTASAHEFPSGDGHQLALGRLKNILELSPELVEPLLSGKQMTLDIPMPTRTQWSAFLNRLSKEADFWQEQSQEAPY